MCVLAIDLISMDGTQSRAAISEETVTEYERLWKEATPGMTVFPPVKVFHDGKQHWLGDGFHRVLAAKRAGRGSIIADVEKGTKRDAILYSVGANQTHGLKRSNADKRTAVLLLLNDEDWVKWSDRKIAEHAGLSDAFVGIVRKELQTVCSSPASKAKDEPREGKDGKKRKPPKPKAPKKLRSQSDEPPVAKPQTFAERVHAHNLEVERFARLVSESIKEPPASFLLESKLTVVQQQVQSVCGTIRTCKVHDKPCPQCEDNGKACKVCGGFGMVTKMTYDGMGGK